MITKTSLEVGLLFFCAPPSNATSLSDAVLVLLENLLVSRAGDAGGVDEYEGVLEGDGAGAGAGFDFGLGSFFLLTGST